MKGSIQFRLNRSRRKAAKRWDRFFKAIDHNARQVGRIHVAIAAAKQAHPIPPGGFTSNEKPEFIMQTRDFNAFATELVRKTTALYGIPAKLMGPPIGL